jgi:hypothetical protein
MDQNELEAIQAQADALVQQAMLQLPNASQSAETVSSEILDFYRAQGPFIRLELPLVENLHAIVPYLDTSIDKTVIILSPGLLSHAFSTDAPC